jgi:hypothetical protein
VETDGSIEYWLNDIEYDPITYLIKCYEQTN